MFCRASATSDWAIPIRNHSDGSGMDSDVWDACEHCLLWEAPCAGAGEDPLSPSSSRNNMGWNDHNHPGPHSLSPCTTEGEEVKPRKEGGVGKRCCFKDVLYFSLFCSLLIISSLLSPGSVCFVCDDIWWVISLWLYINSQTFHYIFSAQSTCRGKWAPLVGIWFPSRVNAPS